MLSWRAYPLTQWRHCQMRNKVRHKDQDLMLIIYESGHGLCISVLLSDDPRNYIDLSAGDL